MRNPSKAIQEIDTLIVGDSIIEDIKPSLMSASNMIRKQCLRGAKAEECTSKVDFSAYKCKKAVLFTLVRITKRLATRKRPLQVN